MRSAQVPGHALLRGLGHALDRPGTYLVVVAVIAMIAWDAYARSTNALLVPTVGEIGAGLLEVLGSGDAWAAFARSNAAMFAGFALAVVIGVPVGLLLGRFRVADEAASIYIGVLLVTPMAAISPLLLMAFGISAWSQVTLVFVFAVVMVVVNSRTGVRQVDPSIIEMGRAYLLPEIGLWRHILIRAALPGVVVGLQLGLGRAIQGMVVGELLLVASGIGGLILNHSARFESGQLYAVIILVIIEALVLSRLLTWLEGRLVPWASHGRSPSRKGHITR